jgi:hypothetical protein
MPEKTLDEVLKDTLKSNDSPEAKQTENKQAVKESEKEKKEEKKEQQKRFEI